MPMPTLSTLTIACLAAVVLLPLLRLARHIARIRGSPLQQYDGPRPDNFLFGDMGLISDMARLDAFEDFFVKYGRSFRSTGLFGINVLTTSDHDAVHHILFKTRIYQKASEGRSQLRVIEDGLLFAEGDKHANQRKTMNPAFAPQHVREVTGIFNDKARNLCSRLLDSFSKESNSPQRINIIPWLSKATLDAIGLAGFGYDLGALDDRKTELNNAFSVVLKQAAAPWRVFLSAVFPWTERFLTPGRQQRVEFARGAIKRIGLRLITARKQAVLNESSGGSITKEDVQEHDLLSVLVKSNMATDIPESKRMSDDDVLAQVPTFLVAGHETSATATTWVLFALSTRPDIQSKLRAELETMDDDPSMEQLESLPYLDAVVRETMRLHAPVPSIGRSAMQDDVIPLAEPIKDRKGALQKTVTIRKGDRVVIPLLVINRMKSIWGPDAHEFNPDRWSSLPDAVSSVNSVWGHSATFGAGPRACIGFRFAIVEVKSLLFHLLRAFEFELGAKADAMGSRARVVQRPYVTTEKEKGVQLPLLMKPVHKK